MWYGARHVGAGVDREAREKKDVDGSLEKIEDGDDERRRQPCAGGGRAKTPDANETRR